MSLVRDPDTGDLVRVCPHCGGASRTLATRCPLCGRLFDEEDSSFIDELPFVEFDWWMGSAGGSLFGLLASALCNIVIFVVIGPLVLLRRGVRRALRARRARL